MNKFKALLVAVSLPLLISCGQEPLPPEVIDCSLDKFKDIDVVVPMQPRSGEEVETGFKVAGCSATASGKVVWQLYAHDGTYLNGGTATGGKETPKKFSFNVRFDEEKTEDLNPAILKISEQSNDIDKEVLIETAIPVLITSTK